MEIIAITEYKDTEKFNALKIKCWECASNDRQFDIDSLPPAEYKYFSKLYFLYNDMHHGKITKDQAEAEEKENYKEYAEYTDARLDYIHGRVMINDNIKRSHDAVTEIEKSCDMQVICEKAVEAVGLLIGDGSFKSRIMAKLEKSDV